MTFGGPLEWSNRAKVAAIVIVAALLVAVGLLSHTTNVVEAAYECPVVDGERGEVRYSFNEASVCAYDDGSATMMATRQPLDWFDPLVSALFFGIGAVVVVTAAVLAVRSVTRPPMDGRGTPTSERPPTDRAA